MILYDDGVHMDKELRMRVCPRCDNGQFSEGANFCRICGMPTQNMCEGEPEYDYNGNLVGDGKHPCDGNARFCEVCGKPTEYFKRKMLKPYEDVRETYVADFIRRNPGFLQNPDQPMIVGGADEDDPYSEDDAMNAHFEEMYDVADIQAAREAGPFVPPATSTRTAAKKATAKGAEADDDELPF